MSEQKTLARAAAELRRVGEPFLVATVVRVLGSSYRRPGARMLLTRERWVAGSISGGCLEKDLVKKAWWLARHGEPVVVTYDATGDEEAGWGFGLGCNGVVDVLLEHAPLPSRVDPIGFFESCRVHQQRAAVLTVFRSDHPGVPAGSRVTWASPSRGGAPQADAMSATACARLVDEVKAEAALRRDETRVASLSIEGATVEALVESVRPPLRLYVFGVGHDAVPVVEFARTLGWDVAVVDPRSRDTTRERFAAADEILAASPAEAAHEVASADHAACVVMNHDYDRDRACLAALLPTRAEYIGVLGPRRRTERMLAELGALAATARLHAPVGLELGAESPQEIALAIVAEIQAATSGATAVSLRQRPGSIHAGALVPSSEAAE